MFFSQRAGDMCASSLLRHETEDVGEIVDLDHASLFSVGSDAGG